jgi:DNA-directed RNA polymerase I subunit RPA2
MYSGILGTEFNADVYIGCVFYQRLRHMVNDKFQVRTTGPVHSLTQQPVKGRKRFGGIRFGEMERDSMIAHGTAFLLKDRLMNCSDYTQSWICRDCGSVLSPLSAISGTGGAGAVRCKSCAVAADGFEKHGEVWEDGGGLRWKGGENVSVVALPYVFKYGPFFEFANVQVSCSRIGMYVDQTLVYDEPFIDIPNNNYYPNMFLCIH